MPCATKACKFSLYADDIKGLCSTEESIERYLILFRMYSHASGAKINPSKYNSMMGKWCNHSDYPFGIS